MDFECSPCCGQRVREAVRVRLEEPLVPLLRRDREHVRRDLLPLQHGPHGGGQAVALLLDEPLKADQAAVDAGVCQKIRIFKTLLFL